MQTSQRFSTQAAVRIKQLVLKRSAAALATHESCTGMDDTGTYIRTVVYQSYRSMINETERRQSKKNANRAPQGQYGNNMYVHREKPGE